VKPVLALVGRPNVGKSTLFNALTRSRDAIVADLAGLTRDRHYGTAKLGQREWLVVDTGGFEPTADSGVVQAMAQQTRQAVAESDVVVFVTDTRAGLSAQDHDIAHYLRRLGKPCVLVANKAEGMRGQAQLAEFFELGMGDVLPLSAAHGQGLRDLADAAEAALALPPSAADDDEPGDDAEAPPIKLAVVGRPNVGKSTLINVWLGEERLVAYDMPGTTRDAIRVPLVRGARRYELIDTAGLRKRGKVWEAVEKFSVIKTLQAIEQCNVALLLLDATQGVTDQDAHIAGFVLEAGRAVVVAVNKWDAVDAYQRDLLQRAMAQRLSFLRFAKVHTISAIKRHGLSPVWASIGQAHAAAFRKLGTPALTRLIHDAVAHQQPPRSGMFRPKLRYAHQGGSNPPLVVVHGNSLDHVSDSYKRYLEGRVREKFNLEGTPLRMEMRSAPNPYQQRRSGK
jgi:GTP-binding protein